MNHPKYIKQVWFVGIGGIGMSALARYFSMKGLPVAGYDRTPSGVTDSLQTEGLEVVFADDPELISPIFREVAGTLVIYTPAVENTQRQLVWFREQGFTVMKRAEVLGLITEGSSAICVAGTHGKTTISTMAAHLFRQSKIGCTAFLGGISKNYDTNFLWDGDSPFVILEADEFDRSFLKLTPHSALVSAVDADHLDIYGDKAQMEQAFVEFGKRVSENGALVVKKGIPLTWQLNKEVDVFTYSIDGDADFYASDIELKNGIYNYTLVTPSGSHKGMQLGIPGLLNVENAIGASALALINGVSADEIRNALPVFKGISRRFEIHIRTNDFVFIDDYAHHPEEIRATINSVRAMYPGYKVSGAFQPHLFSRTRDFAAEFAEALGLLDELFLLPIYPARERPIPGVDSEMLSKLMRNTPVHLCEKDKLAGMVSVSLPEVFLSMGAGDIDRIVPDLKKRFEILVNEK
jgi:UDP-N-acetylmuramate--alanine ligase